MNVGSILNNDSSNEEKKLKKTQHESAFLRPELGLSPGQSQAQSHQSQTNQNQALTLRPIPTPIQTQTPGAIFVSKVRVPSHGRSSIVSLLNNEPEPKRETPNRSTSSTSLTSESIQASPTQQPLQNPPRGSSIVAAPEQKGQGESNHKPSSPESHSGSSSDSSVIRSCSSTQPQKEREAIIQAEIEQIRKLKSSRKPKRYQQPPIWATEWIPPSKYAQRINNGNGGVNAGSLPGGTGIQAVGAADFEPVRYTEKRVFDTSKTASVDLECCITGVIPPASVIRTIAEWIYANFQEIPDKDRKNIELELKFGTIIDKSKGHRLSIDVSTECIYTNSSQIHFEPGVHEDGFNEMIRFLDDLEKGYQDDLAKSGGGNPSRPRRKFNKLESDITDTYYRIAKRGENPKKIRISKDNLLDVERLTAMNKVRISDLYIHNPSSLYDLRLSLSYEFPVPSEEIESIVSKNKVDLTRIKKRQSWTHKPTATRFDLTRVLRPVELKNNKGNKIIEHDQKFEVELEINTIELFNGFDQFKSGQNDIRFEELVEVFVNNARAMNNRVTKFANK